MLRYPGITTSSLLSAVPELQSIDPQTLARVDIDGTSSFVPITQFRMLNMERV